MCLTAQRKLLNSFSEEEIKAEYRRTGDDKRYAHQEQGKRFCGAAAALGGAHRRVSDLPNRLRFTAQCRKQLFTHQKGKIENSYQVGYQTTLEL
jgi:hypothetical protein